VLAATPITLALIVLPVASGHTQFPKGAAKARVACWNTYFPFESGGPDFFAAPTKCLWYKRNAETYAEGALLGKKLTWRWREDHARAHGTLKVPGVGDEFARGWVELTKPTESCGRLVFSRIEYRLRAPSGRAGSYPIYTCRSNYD
jgi:hypothetical protein